MSIASEILRLQNAKIDIKVSIENKGVTVPSNETIDNYPSYIDQITTGGGGGQDTSQLIDIIEKDITNLVIPSGTTTIGKYVFFQCTGLTSVTIPNSVTYIGQSAFYDCRSLTSINIPSGVTTIDQSAFEKCTSLASITIPSSVIGISDYAFQFCNALSSVTIEATNPPRLGNYVFQYNASGRKIYVPSGSVETYKTAWPEYASAIEAIPTT